MMVLYGECPKCNATLRVRRCQVTGKEDYYSSVDNHNCDLEARRSGLCQEAKDTIIKYYNRDLKVVDILEIVRARSIRLSRPLIGTSGSSPLRGKSSRVI
jgi:hypothetical protein